MLAPLLFAVEMSAHALVGQLPPPPPPEAVCTLDENNNINLKCTSNPSRTTLPTATGWGSFNVATVTGMLDFYSQAITVVPDNGFDACPYTDATDLNLILNAITEVGAEAFKKLAKLKVLGLGFNQITAMAANALTGLIKLEQLYLNNNRIGEFHFGSLAPMTSLGLLFLQNQQGTDQTPNCVGVDTWGTFTTPDPNGIAAAAVASCGGLNSCPNGAVACQACATTASCTSTTTNAPTTADPTTAPLVVCTKNQNSVRCRPHLSGGPKLTAVPTGGGWGGFTVEEITGILTLPFNLISVIPDNGFNACPYTNANGLHLENNVITAVGTRAFAKLPALKNIQLHKNRISFMAANALAGLPELVTLYLNDNRLGAFDYSALANMNALGTLRLSGQPKVDLSCDVDGTANNDWYNDVAGVAAAVATCGASGSPCKGCAVACEAAIIGTCSATTTDAPTTVAPPPVPPPGPPPGPQTTAPVPTTISRVSTTQPISTTKAPGPPPGPQTTAPVPTTISQISTTQPISTTKAQESKKSTSLGAGAIAGIVVGALAVIALAAYAISTKSN